MVTLRVLTEIGTKEFMKNLVLLKENPEESLPNFNYAESPFSIPFDPEISIDDNDFISRLDLGRYLNQIFQNVNRELIVDNEGLWNWLTIHWFDQICPVNQNGQRKIGEFARYTYNSHYTRYYRHLVAASWDIYSKYGEKSKIFLQTPLTVTNQFTLELACRQNMISNENLVDVILALYWQRRKDGIEGPKRSATTKKAPGNIYRLITLMNQFEMTYDVYNMQAQDIIDLLPMEFNKWKGIAKSSTKKGIRDLFNISQYRIS